MNPSIELIVARYNEDVTWLNEVDTAIGITIYNKGNDLHNIPDRAIVKELPNIGRESHTYATHCAARYDSLADITVFTQGNPFTHSPRMLQLLEFTRLKAMPSYQTLSLKYMGLDDAEIPIPPVEVIGDEKYTREETFSLFTLDAIRFHDLGTCSFYEDYLKYCELPYGTNIMHHFFATVGLPDRVPSEQLIGNFPYAALFVTHKLNVLQHPKRVYERIAKTSTQHPCIGFIIERCWRMLFEIK